MGNFWTYHENTQRGGIELGRVIDPAKASRPVIYLESDPPGLDAAKVSAFMPYYVYTPMSFTQDLPGVAGGDAAATFVPGGSTFSATVEVAGGQAPFTYQWYKFSGGVGTAITLAQNATAQSKVFQITNYTAAAQPGSGNGDWYVVVTDATGATLQSQRIRTKQAIAYSVNLPTTDTWTVGTADALTVTVNAATGLAPYTHEWFKDGVSQGPGTSSGTGNATSTLSKASPAAGDAGVYYCISTSANTNPPKTIQSISCTVTVNPAA
ncbi:hypothetical protein sortregn_13 [Escherichia phage sortregn]|nr:hypothetical protein sortregn_13 [Escherichia phage sortregn]